MIKDGEIRWAGKERDLSRELAQGQRVEITVRARDSSAEDVRRHGRGERSRASPPFRRSRPCPRTSPGRASARSSSRRHVDVRDEVCRLLVGADLGILQVARKRELENLLIDMLGEPTEVAQGKRRRKKRALEGPR